MKDKLGGYSSGPSESMPVLPVYPAHMKMCFELMKSDTYMWLRVHI